MNDIYGYEKAQGGTFGNQCGIENRYRYRCYRADHLITAFAASSPRAKRSFPPLSSCLQSLKCRVSSHRLQVFP